ncbi:MAG: WbqC family protein [Bacteroidota bacterium]|nr:WbqC family protein [Bacteroidota bacterium]
MDFKSQNYSILLIESQLFPPAKVMSWMIQHDKVIIEAQEHYQKRSLRNRYYMGSNQGPIVLSVPLLKGKNRQKPIQEVEIDYKTDWPALHWKTIQSNYGRSPFFVYYKDELKSILFTKHLFLFDLNLQTLKWALSKLSVVPIVQKSKQYHPQVENEVFDARNKIGSQWILEQTEPSYYQIFSLSSGFQGGLSFLDLLFHLGPESFFYLKDYPHDTIHL